MKEATFVEVVQSGETGQVYGRFLVLVPIESLHNFNWLDLFSGTQATFVELVQSGETGQVYGSFLVLVPIEGLQNFNAVDLFSGTQFSAADSRAVAKLVVAETQRAVTAGELVFP